MAKKKAAKKKVAKKTTKKTVKKTREEEDREEGEEEVSDERQTKACPSRAAIGEDRKRPQSDRSSVRAILGERNPARFCVLQQAFGKWKVLRQGRAFHFSFWGSHGGVRTCPDAPAVSCGLRPVSPAPCNCGAIRLYWRLVPCGQR